MAELKRVAGYGTIVALTIGSVLGTGLFFGQAIGAGIAGNAEILSWVIYGIISLYVGACFGELVALFPMAGGVYEFGKQTYGRFASFIIGWLAWLVGNISTVVFIVAAIDYILPGSQFIYLKMGLSCLFLILLNFIIYFGVKESSVAVIIFTAINLLVVLVVLIPGLLVVNPSNFTPFFAYGFAPVLLTIFLIAESFFGWEAASYMAEETKDPQTVIPRSILISTAIVGLIAVLLAVGMLGLIPYKELALSNAPLALYAQTIAARFGFAQASPLMSIISIGVYLSMIGMASGTVLTMPRLIMAMARDKLFLQQFSEVHPRFFTPYKAILFQLIASLIIVVIGFWRYQGKYETLLSLLVPLGLFMYSAVLLAVPILRHTKPDLERKFKVPLGTVGPVLVVIFFLVLVVLWVANEPNATQILGLGGSLLIIGIPLYMLIELYNDPEMITEVNDLLAYATLATEWFNLPKNVVDEMLVLLGDVRGKNVLEFGCNVGTLTMRLADGVGISGSVYATSFSKNHIKITKKRIDRHNWLAKTMLGKVYLIHDREHTSRVHPDITSVDSAVSVGMISYLQDVQKVLCEINTIMPDGGKICFMEYGDFFSIIPNAGWLSTNEEIEKVFRSCGFSVQVKRKRGLFWNYIFIYGMKFGRDVPFI